MKSSFITPLVVEVLDGGRRFKLHYDFTYHWKRHRIKVCVKAGFISDFASIPRLARIIIPKLGRWNKPAVVHDWLYKVKSIMGEPITRAEADLCFRDGLKDRGVAKWQYNLIYYSVRAFGWLAWRRE